MLSWIDDALTKFHISNDENIRLKLDNYRAMVERSSLIERIYGTCRAINAHGRDGLIYGQMFARPYALAFRVGFVRGNTESRMSLAILNEGPALIFSSIKVEPLDSHGRHYFRHFRRRREKFICRIALNPAAVKDAEIQQWFTYLLSGLKRSFKPTGELARPRLLSRVFSAEGSI
jgi:hypothetical protein